MHYDPDECMRNNCVACPVVVSLEDYPALAQWPPQEEHPAAGRALAAVSVRQRNGCSISEDNW
jgi:hypothetical protein